MKTRDRILETARTLFNDSPVHTVTTNHIAAAAGISPGNLYYHFRNREQIVLELFDRMRADEAEVCHRIDGITGLESLGTYYRNLFGVYRHYRFLLREPFSLMQADPEFRAAWLAYLDGQVEEVTNAMRQLADRGVIDSMLTDRLPSEALILSLVLTGVFSRLPSPDPDTWLEGEELAVRLILHQAEHLAPAVGGAPC